jgi:hypothetical protein
VGALPGPGPLLISPRAPYTVWSREPPGPELQATIRAGPRTRTADSDHDRPGELTLLRRAGIRVATGPDARLSPWVSSQTRVLLRCPGQGPFKLGWSRDRPETSRGGRWTDHSPGPRGVSQAAGVVTVLTGPWPAPLAGFGRTGRPGLDPDCAIAGAASRRAEDGRASRAMTAAEHVKCKGP